MSFRGAWFALAAPVAVFAGCRPADGCMGGDDGACVPKSACTALAYSCPNPALELRTVAGPEDVPPGQKAAAAPGDILLRNSLITPVLDAPGSPHFLSPSGGTVLDLVPNQAGSTDELDNVMQAIGILPDDAARYDSVQLIDQRPALVAAVFRGKLDLRPKIDIVTRYELRACEPGLRIRTEIYHGGRDPLTMFPADAFFWGDRSATPLLAGQGLGFDYPDLDLAEVGKAFREVSFLVADAHTSTSAAYGLIPCDRTLSSGFHSKTLTATGAPRSIVMPGDAVAFERFLVTAPGPGLSRVLGLVTNARTMQHGESYVTVRGRVVDTGGAGYGGDERRAAILFYEPASGPDPDARGGRVSWGQAVPDSEGRFEVRLPASRNYRGEIWQMGKALAERFAFATGSADVSISPEPVVAPLGSLHVHVSGPSGEPLISELVLRPSDDQPDASRGSVFGLWDLERCSPYLGPPHGASPACNRVIVDASGEASFELRPGSYYVYATHGPFWSLGRAPVQIVSGAGQEIVLQLHPLGILPHGTLSADFHVHGGASFDSSLPDRDRVLQFIASGTDVIAATDHDVVTSYDATLQSLGLQSAVEVMSGVETTGQILFLRPPGSDIPKVIGHFNFWPVQVRADAPRHGAIADERLEPGALFDRMMKTMDGRGVIQLNHPYGESELGRDTGYLRAIGYDPRKTIPAAPNDTPEGQLPRRTGGGLSNLDFDAQEVMNGGSIRQHLMYRAGWFSLLNQGYLRAGTANSDSHTSSVETLGYPRNLVFGGHTLEGFDRQRFNDNVRAGRLVGTNGPVLTVCLREGNDCIRPSLQGVQPAADATLDITVAAAPWIPVSEVRVFVSGAVVKTIPVERPQGLDPFGVVPLGPVLFNVPIAELTAAVPASEDFWIVVEAGMPLAEQLGYDGDGVPDPESVQEAGAVPPTDERYHVQTVAPGVWPTAFSNPILIDRAGDGWKARGRP